MAWERGLKKGDVHPVYKAMNLLKYDASAVGNHEFNYGLDFLAAADSGLTFPVVGVNVEPAGSGKSYSNGHEILTRQVTDEQGQVHSLKVGDRFRHAADHHLGQGGAGGQGNDGGHRRCGPQICP